MFVRNRMLEGYRGRRYRVPMYLRRPVATIHLSIAILGQMVIIAMMIIDTGITETKEDTMITIGTGTIVIIMMVMIIGTDMTVILTIIGKGKPDVAIVMCHRFITVIETIRPTEAEVVVQVDDMSMMRWIGRHDVTKRTMNLTVKVVDESGLEARIGAVVEKKRRGVIVVTARAHRAARLSVAWVTFTKRSCD